MLASSSLRAARILRSPPMSTTALMHDPPHHLCSHSRPRFMHSLTHLHPLGCAAVPPGVAINAQAVPTLVLLFEPPAAGRLALEFAGHETAHGFRPHSFASVALREHVASGPSGRHIARAGGVHFGAGATSRAPSRARPARPAARRLLLQRGRGRSTRRRTKRSSGPEEAVRG